MRIMDESEYQEFDDKFKATNSSSTAEQDRDKLADDLERGLYLIGATAVEDKL